MEANVDPAVRFYITANSIAFDSAIFCHGDILDAVQRARLYPDSKTFVDMLLKMDPDVVLADFQALKAQGPLTKDTIKAFVEEHFSEAGKELEKWKPKDWSQSPTVLKKIKDPQLRHFADELNNLWELLGRKMKPEVESHPTRHSLLPVPNPFIVPGDRFGEFYYWDTYWIIGGLLLCDMTETAKGMLGNFFHMVEKYGMVPNGGRVYLLNRSQPPLLTPMVALYHQHTGDLNFVRQQLPLLEKEYNFWLKERTESVTCRQTGQSHDLACYRVQVEHPRPEGYLNDVELTAGMSEEDRVRTLSHIASACESGWDFSTRWLHDGHSLRTIKTSRILPVDLNVFLCITEQQLAQFHGLLGDQARQEYYAKQAEKRRCAINDLMWNGTQGAWFDLDLDTMTSRTEFYPSNVFPVLAGCADGDQKIKDDIVQYLKRMKVDQYQGGVPTSLITSGQQWDFPSTWSPLVHLVIEALTKLQTDVADQLAITLAQNWLNTNYQVWKATGHMYEKYNAECPGSAGGGGEYKVQLGFGWTNGVVLMLLDKFGQTLTASQ